MPHSLPPYPQAKAILLRAEWLHSIRLSCHEREEEGSRDWVPGYPSCAESSWRNLFFSNDIQEYWGGASITGVREEIGKEADENIKEHLRDAVPADYTRLQQEICPQPLGPPHPRMSTGSAYTTNAWNAKPKSPITLELAPCIPSQVQWRPVQ